MQDSLNPQKQEIVDTSSMEAINDKIIPTNTTKQQTSNTEDVETEEKLPKLRPRLVRFCENIVSGKTQVESYKQAGYKPKNDNVASVQASRLLDIPNVNRYITIRENQIQDKLRKDTEITREKVLRMYYETAQRCAQDIKPVINKKGEHVETEDKDGNLAKAYTFDHRGVTGGLDGVARILGFNAAQKIDTTVSAANASMDISLLTPEEKLALSNMLKKVYAKPAESLPAKVIGKIEAAK
jgi:phage terminase small subunit